MKLLSHIPQIETIQAFFDLVRIGMPKGDDFSITRLEDQPKNKRTEVPLFRGNIYRILLLFDSEVQWNLPTSQWFTSNQCAYFAYPGKLESWVSGSNNKGFLICFTETFTKSFQASASLNQTFPFFNFESPSLLFLDNQATNCLKDVAEQMIEEMTHLRKDYREMLQHLLFQLMILLKRIYLNYQSQIPIETRNSTLIYNRFKSILDQYFIDLASNRKEVQASVSILADQMAINASYLNTTIKKLTGKTASHHISEKIVLEAKSYLTFTNLQVAEIAHKLGFNHLSYFIRFFKKNTGVTPKQYRLTFQLS